MNVLLIQPPVRDFYQTSMRTQPLGLAYLAAVLRQAGHTVSLLDCQAPGLRSVAPVPESMAYLRRYYPPADISPFRLHTRYYYFGLPQETITSYIRERKPDVVGVSCPYTAYVQETREIASLVKKVSPSTPVIVGGAHASALPEQVLYSLPVEYVVIGEGERTVVELLACIQRCQRPDKLDGIAFKNGNTVFVHPPKGFIQNLDLIPFPARDLLNPIHYTVDGRPYTMILTGRGCPYGCSYCSVATVMGKEPRLRSPENIVKEMVHCVQQYGIRVFDIEDDHFNVDRQRALDILELAIERFGENSIELYAMNGLSLMSLDKKLLKAMRRAGFRKMDLALGCTTAAEGRLMGRSSNRRKARSIVRRLACLGIPSTTYIILGIPGQRLRDMVSGLKYLSALPTLIGPSVFYPSPGSLLYASLQNDGKLPADFSLMRSSAFPVETAECSRLELVTLVRLARWINWIKRMLVRSGETAVKVEEVVGNDRLCSRPPEQVFNKITLYGSAELYLPQIIDSDAAGRLLTWLLFHYRVFYGLRRIKEKGMKAFRYELFPYETAQTVIDCFFKAAHKIVIEAAPDGVGRAGGLVWKQS